MSSIHNYFFGFYIMVKGTNEHTCRFKLTSTLVELKTQDLCLRFSQYIIESTLNLNHVKTASKKIPIDTH